MTIWAAAEGLPLWAHFQLCRFIYSLTRFCANLETSARVTSLLILLLGECLCISDDGRTVINPPLTCRLQPVPWASLLLRFQFQWKLSVMSISGLEISVEYY